MKTQFNTYKECPDWWDEEVKKHGGLFTSASLWGQFHKDYLYASITYIEVQESGKRIMLLLAYDFVIGAQLLPRWIVFILSPFSFLRSYNMHLQPVIIDKSYLKDEKKLYLLTKKLLHFLITIIQKEKKGFIASDFICFKDVKYAKLLHKSFPSFSKVIGTSRLSLDSSIEDLYKSMNESVKSGVRKCEKLNVKVKLLTPLKINDFYSGLKKGWNGQHIAVNSMGYYKEIIRKYPDNIKYFVAYKGRKVLAGSGIMVFGKTILEFSMFITPEARLMKIPAGDIVKWEIIKFGIQNGYKFLDFNMIAVAENKELDNKIKNINFYKLKWGGSLIYGISFQKLSLITLVLRKIKLLILGH